MKTAAKTKKKTAALQLRPLRLPDRTVTVLPNGLTVTIVERGPLPLVAVRYITRAGSVFDPADRLGLAELTARLLRRGAGGQGAEELAESVDYVGASLGAWAGEDSFGLSLNTPVAHFDAMLDTLARVLRRPDFPEHEVALARRRTLAQLANALDDPDDLADRALVAAVFGQHPYGHETIGSKAHVEAMTRNDLVRFHRERLVPQGAHLFVVGDVDGKRALAAIERVLGDWSGENSGQLAVPVWSELARSGDVVIVDKPEQTQAQVRIAAKGVYRGHPDHSALMVMNSVLGGSFTSRLMQEIRVKRGLTYGAGSHFDQLAHAGTFAVSSFTKTETVPELIDVALAEVKKMRAKGPKPDELSSAQRYISGLYPARLETNESIAAALADMALYGLPADWVDQYRERIAAVTVKVAAEAAARHLPDDDQVIVLVGNAEQLKPQVEGYGRVSVVPAAQLE
ncbi:MAG: insulinase family protein [Archangiaceae bacterium]|nr:insulinase family protein [Archangiaceae bacterium]